MKNYDSFEEKRLVYKLPVSADTLQTGVDKQISLSEISVDFEQKDFNYLAAGLTAQLSKSPKRWRSFQELRQKRQLVKVAAFLKRTKRFRGKMIKETDYFRTGKTIKRMRYDYSPDRGKTIIKDLKWNKLLQALLNKLIDPKEQAKLKALAAKAREAVKQAKTEKAKRTAEIKVAKKYLKKIGRKRGRNKLRKSFIKHLVETKQDTAFLKETDWDKIRTYMRAFLVKQNVPTRAVNGAIKILFRRMQREINPGNTKSNKRFLAEIKKLKPKTKVSRPQEAVKVGADVKPSDFTASSQEAVDRMVSIASRFYKSLIESLIQRYVSNDLDVSKKPSVDIVEARINKVLSPFHAKVHFTARNWKSPRFNVVIDGKRAWPTISTRSKRKKLKNTIVSRVHPKLPTKAVATTTPKTNPASDS